MTQNAEGSDTSMEDQDPLAERQTLDVMGLLEAASEQLAVGEMLHSSAFNLFNVMSAVEIGDPRLDAGSSPKITPTLISFMQTLSCAINQQ